MTEKRPGAKRGAEPPSRSNPHSDHPELGLATARTYLWIHVVPRAGKTEVVGWHGDAVKVRVKATPVEGAANEELTRFLAKEVGVPRQAVQIASGASSRRKRVAIDGLGDASVLTALGL